MPGACLLPRRILRAGLQVRQHLLPGLPGAVLCLDSLFGGARACGHRALRWDIRGAALFVVFVLWRLAGISLQTCRALRQPPHWAAGSAAPWHPPHQAQTPARPFALSEAAAPVPRCCREGRRVTRLPAASPLPPLHAAPRVPLPAFALEPAHLRKALWEAHPASVLKSAPLHPRLP